MIDTSIEWKRVILKRLPGTVLPAVRIPEGYAFAHYQEGDEQAWGEIETSAGNFDTVEEAIAFFRQHFLIYPGEVKRRTFFLQEQSSGKKVATFTAWWEYTGQRRYPFMRRVSVRSDYQGRGLGKAIVVVGLHQMVAIEGDTVMYIPTRTWSHRAIKIYRQVGFELEMTEPAPGGYENQTAEAFPLIQHLI
jgi:GNAT superfamily N-acetyltransferase